MNPGESIALAGLMILAAFWFHPELAAAARPFLPEWWQ
ncbi:hypothetical protein GGR19_002728 [Croceicoccus naphthovorans]|nr:hypothetical protein [Croceicoccus naphthovorans]